MDLGVVAYLGREYKFSARCLSKFRLERLAQKGYLKYLVFDNFRLKKLGAFYKASELLISSSSSDSIE